MAKVYRECEIVEIIARDESGYEAYLKIPAFTVDESILRERISNITDEYLNQSKEDDEKVSLGDFGLFVLSIANDDPDYTEIGA